MNDLSSLMADLASGVNRERKKQDAVALVEATSAAIRSLGFEPEMYPEKIWGNDHLVLRVDLSALDVIGSTASFDRAEYMATGPADPTPIDLASIQGQDLEEAMDDEKCVDELRQKSFDEVQRDYSEEEKERLQALADKTVESLDEDLASIPLPPDDADFVPDRVAQETEALVKEPATTETADDAEAEAPADEPGPRLGRWSKTDEDKLIDMVIDGSKPQEIAEALGRDVKAVQNKRTRCKAEIKKRRAELKKVKRTLSAHLGQLTSDPLFDHSKMTRFLQHFIKGAGVAGAGALVGMSSSAAHELHKLICPKDAPWTAKDILNGLNAMSPAGQEV